MMHAPGRRYLLDIVWRRGACAIHRRSSYLSAYPDDGELRDDSVSQFKDELIAVPRLLCRRLLQNEIKGCLYVRQIAGLRQHAKCGSFLFFALFAWRPWRLGGPFVRASQKKNLVLSVQSPEPAMKVGKTLWLQRVGCIIILFRVLLGERWENR